MKSRKFLPLLLPLIIFLTSGDICHGADIFVDDDICPATGSGTSIDPYCSIAYAITLAASGDTVYIHQGTYAEAIIMKTGVDLHNVSGEQPQIVTSEANNHVVFDRVNNCTLDGFVLDDSSRTTEDGYAMVYVEGDDIDPGDGLAIRNCEMTGAPVTTDALATTGIRLIGKVSIEITGNTIKNMKHAGITTRPRGNTVINDSTVIIQGNIITENFVVGIDIDGNGLSNRLIIGGDGDAANTISNNGWFGKGTGIRLQEMQGVSIDNNDISNNSHAGILLVDTNTVSPHISRNTIHDNLNAGINIAGASTLTISNNEIFHNGSGGVTCNVDIDSFAASSAPITITGNNIHTNATAGIAVVNHVTGPITITGNMIHQNEKAAIAFFDHCIATITDNDIYDHAGAAGIFTGDWVGEKPPDAFGFNRTNGPVELTISRNKIHDNLAGMRLDHASGTINNNLVYNNSKSGIRFSGNDVVPYEPFGISWGITSLNNNTVTDNGTLVDGIHRGGGGGIVYDDVNITDRGFNTKPVQNRAQGPRFIQNNILSYNVSAGVNDASCSVERDYNLYYWNFGRELFSTNAIGSCHTGEAPDLTGNPNEIFADPLFIDKIAYQLQLGSPAKASGNDGLDMGAYGGSDPITW